MGVDTTRLDADGASGLTKDGCSPPDADDMQRRTGHTPTGADAGTSSFTADVAVARLVIE